MPSDKPVFISEDELKSLTDWKEILYVLEQAFISASNDDGKDKATTTTTASDQPYSSQPARSFVGAGEGVLLCMPGFMGNHTIFKNDSNRVSTLACKLITSFGDNPKRVPPLPDINGNIFLFDEVTGKLRATLEANYLTGLRTAAASIVATEQVFMPRVTDADSKNLVLGIIGTGTQGEFHAIGFMKTHKFANIKLWNRTKSRAEQLKDKLIQLAPESVNPNVAVTVHDSVEDCLRNCDIIVTATSSSVPLVFKRFLKENVHINALGAGRTHHAELAQDIYDESQVFIDYQSGAKKELAGLKSTIVGEIGEVLLNRKSIPSSGITVFQSIGMAVEDVAIGRLFHTKFQHSNNH
ncbi:ketimine reductase mu-crystallin [Uranotaenia lowii]|uniref:ketimine reductase mu-crystallin n=1 Tax=Uranotaenia lowii TaxID=190385 RepID=UPI00247A6D2F|nr:ketimine reductase mu-crystallin [Uranotaenia lowii]